MTAKKLENLVISHLTQNGAMNVSDSHSLQELFEVIASKGFDMPKELIELLPIVRFNRFTREPITNESFDYNDIMERATDKKLVGKVNISEEIAGDFWAVVRALVHNIIHVIQHSSGTPSAKKQKHNAEFRDIAEKYGVIAEKHSDDKNGNFGYANIILTKEFVEKVGEHIAKYEFYFKTAVKSSETKDKTKKEKIYYVHPNGIDYVVTSDPQDIFAKVGDEFVAYIRTTADSPIMQEVRQKRKERNRTHPEPQARGGVFA